MVVWEDLVVKNATDVENAARGISAESDVRHTTVHFKVDTGAHFMLLTREVADALGLRIIGKQPVSLAGGEGREFDKAGGIQIWWQDRWAIMDTLVVPNGTRNLLSCTAMELLGVKPNPMTGRLEPAYPDGIIGMVE